MPQIRPITDLRNTNEIMGNPSDVNALYESLNRCQVAFPQDLTVRSNWEEVADELKQYEQVLCIVSDRKSCRELYSLMPEDAYHLSALMCGQHRSETIDEIKQKLKNNEAVRVISTQLVEAGVDFDFPVVYRALAGLDSIAQAAGRCNREGKLASGQVVVFVPPQPAPVGILRKATDIAYSIISTNNDPLNHEVFRDYFAELYWKANSLDEMDIIPLLSREVQECSIYFRTAAERFHIIDDSLQKSVLIRYGEGDGLINRLKYAGPDRWLLRRLQRYTVNVYNQQFYQMLEAGLIEEVYPNIYAISSSNQYSKDIGLIVDTNLDPEFFII
jgi:CRISPR-associated endonuclease/helicase Cas3